MKKEGLGSLSLGLRGGTPLMRRRKKKGEKLGASLSEQLHHGEGNGVEGAAKKFVESTKGGGGKT